MNRKFFSMSGWEAVEVQGPESKDFLNRITSADFKNLNTDHWTEGTLLSPTGKINLYFLALQNRPDCYLLLVPPHTGELQSNPETSPAQAAALALEKMHFIDKLTITAVEHQWCFYRVLLPEHQKHSLPQNWCANTFIDKPATSLCRISFSAESQAFSLKIDRWTIDRWSGSSSPYYADLGFVLPASEESKFCGALVAAGFEQGSELEQEELRIRTGDPVVAREITSQVIPLETGLEAAVHENKGCYPGQEVIERIRSMGQSPRQLVCVQGTGHCPQIPQTIQNKEGLEAGTMTSAISSGSLWYGLGFLKKAHVKNLQEGIDSNTYQISGQPIEIRLRSRVD